MNDKEYEVQKNLGTAPLWKRIERGDGVVRDTDL